MLNMFWLYRNHRTRLTDLSNVLVIHTQICIGSCSESSPSAKRSCPGPCVLSYICHFCRSQGKQDSAQLGATSSQRVESENVCLFCHWHLISPQMKVPARIQLPKTKRYGSSFVNLLVWLAAVFDSVSVLKAITTIRICPPWLSLHFLVSHHILFRLNADLLYLTPHSAGSKDLLLCLLQEVNQFFPCLLQ